MGVRVRRRDWNVAGATMSTWHPTRMLTGYSWDAITAGCFLGPRVPESLLMLGLGGGTVVRQLLHLVPKLHITAVDLDPRALRETTNNLGPLAGQVTMVEADAYGWLDAARTEFDVVIDDVYASGPQDVFRPRPMDRELVEALKGKTTRGGVVVANFVLGPGHRATQVEARAAFMAGFARMRTLCPPRGYNTVLVGGEQLSTGRALRAWSPAWPAKERTWWDQLKVR